MKESTSVAANACGQGKSHTKNRRRSPRPGTRFLQIRVFFVNASYTSIFMNVKNRKLVPSPLGAVSNVMHLGEGRVYTGLALLKIFLAEDFSSGT